LPSGVTRHKIADIVFNGTFSPPMVLSNKNKVFVPTGLAVPESYATGTVDVQTGSINFTVAFSNLVFPIDKFLKKTLYGSTAQLDYVTLFFRLNHATAYLRLLQVAHYQMNPEMPHSIEDLTIDWGDGDVLYGTSPARVGPISVPLGDKGMYCLILGSGDSDPLNFDLDLFGFGLEYSSIEA